MAIFTLSILASRQSRVDFSLFSALSFKISRDCSPFSPRFYFYTWRCGETRYRASGPLHIRAFQKHFRKPLRQLRSRLGKDHNVLGAEKKIETLSKHSEHTHRTRQHARHTSRPETETETDTHTQLSPRYNNYRKESSVGRDGGRGNYANRANGSEENEKGQEDVKAARVRGPDQRGGGGRLHRGKGVGDLCHVCPSTVLWQFVKGIFALLS